MMMWSSPVKKGLLGGRSSSNLTLAGLFISLEVHPGKGNESRGVNLVASDCSGTPGSVDTHISLMVTRPVPSS